MATRALALRIGVVAAVSAGLLANSAAGQGRRIEGGEYVIHAPTKLEFQLPYGFTVAQPTEEEPDRQSWVFFGRPVFGIDLIVDGAESFEKMNDGIEKEFTCKFRVERFGQAGPLPIAIVVRTDIADPGFDGTDVIDLGVRVGEHIVRLLIYAKKGHTSEAVHVANWMSHSLRKSGDLELDSELLRREVDLKTELSWRAPCLMRRDSAGDAVVRFVQADGAELTLSVSTAKSLKSAIGARGMRSPSLVTLPNDHGLDIQQLWKLDGNTVHTKAVFRPHSDGPYVLVTTRAHRENHRMRRYTALFAASLCAVDVTRAELDSIARSDRVRRSVRFEEAPAVVRAVEALAELGFMPSATDTILELFLRLEGDAQKIAARALRADTPDRVKRVLTLLSHRGIANDPVVSAALCGSLTGAEDIKVLNFIERRIKRADPIVVNAMARLLARAPSHRERAVSLLANAFTQLERRAKRDPERIDADGTATAIRDSLEYLTGLRFAKAAAVRAWLRSRATR